MAKALVPANKNFTKLHSWIVLFSRCKLSYALLIAKLTIETGRKEPSKLQWKLGIHQIVCRSILLLCCLRVRKEYRKSSTFGPQKIEIIEDCCFESIRSPIYLAMATRCPFRLLGGNLLRILLLGLISNVLRAVVANIDGSSPFLVSSICQTKLSVWFTFWAQFLWPRTLQTFRIPDRKESGTTT